MLRVVTGSGLLLLVWASVVPSPPWVFAVLMTVAITIGGLEACAMMEGLELRPLRVPALLTIWAAIGAVAFATPPYAVALPLALGTVIITVAAMGTRDSPLAILRTVGGTGLPLLLAFLLTYTIALRNEPDVGRQLLIALFLVVIAGDTAAFYVGRKFGRHKLARVISPKKTWEGAIGGVVAGVAAVLLVQWLWFPGLPTIHAVILGFLLSSSAILGDLAESVIKRASGVKDSSRLLPGHGGVLDRLDSLLFSGPILYYYYTYFVG